MRTLSNLAARFTPAALLPLVLLFATGCSRYNANGSTSLFGLVILVLDVLALIDVFRQSWDTGKKILWVAIIWFLPILGLILYYLVSGRNKPA